MHPDDCATFPSRYRHYGWLQLIGRCLLQYRLPLDWGDTGTVQHLWVSVKNGMGQWVYAKVRDQMSAKNFSNAGIIIVDCSTMSIKFNLNCCRVVKSMCKLAWQDWLVGGPALKTSSLWDIDITQAVIILRKWSHIILKVIDYLWSCVAVLTYTFACIVGAGNLVMHHSRCECSHSSGIGDGTTEPAPQFKLDTELLWHGNRFYYSSTVEVEKHHWSQNLACWIGANHQM